MSEIKYTELDFVKIKNNLKNFLKSQEKFKDYNFDGAGVSVLLDLLAYNTAYNGFYLNMVANEMFLDSAVLRNNIVSRAKHLNYTPKSRICLKAIVDIEIIPSEGPAPLDPNPVSIFLDKSHKFYTVVDGKKYNFTPIKSHLITPDAQGKYIARDVELIEGQKLIHTWIYDESDLNQKFIIPNANIDTTQLKVTIQASETNPSISLFTEHKDFNELNPESKVYFLQEHTDETYEILFGDGVVGKKLQTGNVIKVEYVVSTGNIAVGATKFIPTSKIGGYEGSYVRIKAAASGFIEKESIESIKKLAPLAYDAQNRAVTKLDYETLIKKDIASVQYLRVWGGEEDINPQYGKVFISIKPYTGLTLSEDQKQSLIQTYIRPRNPISIEVIIVEPEYIRIQTETQILYRSSETILSESDIKNKVLSQIRNFRETELNGFDADFRYSRFVNVVDSADPVIRGNLTNIKMKYRIFPPLNVPTKFDIRLNNSIDTGDATNNTSSINSTGFIYKGVLTYIGDDGKGILYLYRIVNDQKVIIENNIGTVNYLDGNILLNSLLVQSIPEQKDYIDLVITPEIQDIDATRSQILLLEDEDIKLFTRDLSRR